MFIDSAIPKSMKLVALALHTILNSAGYLAPLHMCPLQSLYKIDSNKEN